MRSPSTRRRRSGAQVKTCPRRLSREGPQGTLRTVATPSAWLLMVPPAVMRDVYMWPVPSGATNAHRTDLNRDECLRNVECDYATARSAPEQVRKQPDGAIACGQSGTKSVAIAGKADTSAIATSKKCVPPWQAIHRLGRRKRHFESRSQPGGALDGNCPA